MDYTVTISNGARTTALGRARAAYNASNPTLTEPEFLQKLVEGVLDGLIPSYVTTKLTKLAFLDRFTPAERMAIREAGKTNAMVNDYLELLNAASEVDLTSSRTTSGVAALESAALIAAGRGAEILAL